MVANAMPGESAVRLAAQLYETRDAAKFMLGERWSAYVEQVRGIINDIIEKSPRKDLSPLVVAKELATNRHCDAKQAICLLGVAVEMTEPSRV